MANKNAVRLGGAYVEITADNGKLIAGLHDSEERVKNFSSEFAKAGAAFSGIGLGIAAPMKEAVESFADFEKQMLMTRAVTQSTDAQMRRLTAQAKELGATTSWTASQVAEGMQSLGRMGFKNSEIKQTISSVMDLGRALNIDVSTASKELGAVMRQFGASSREAGHYADVLATATNSAAIEMSELLETMKYVGAAGNALGADVETVLALTMALRDTGVSASQAGTQLRSMFLKLQSPKNIKLFGEKFETEIYDAQGRLRSFIDILVDAQTRAATMGDKLAVVARQMFGTLQAPAFVSLMKTKNLERFRDMLYDCDGAAEKFRESMESGVFGALKLTESAIEAVGLQLGEALEPSMRDVVTLVQDVSTVVRGFIQDNRPLINMLAETGVAFTTVGGAILAGTGIVKGLAGVTSLTVGVFGRVIEAWRKAGVEVTELAAETNVAADAMERLNATASGDALAQSLGRANAAAKEVAASVVGLNSEMESLGKGTTQKTGFGLEPEIRRIDTRGMAFSEPVLYATNVANGTYKVRRRNSRAHVNADSQEGIELMRARSESERAASAERAASVRDARNWADDAMITSVQNDIRRSTKELNAEHERIRRANTPTDAGIQQATDNLNQAIDASVVAHQGLEAQRQSLEQTGKEVADQVEHWEQYKDDVTHAATQRRDRIKSNTEKLIQENEARTAREVKQAREAGENEAAAVREAATKEIASAREDIRAANASVSGLTPVEPFTAKQAQKEEIRARRQRNDEQKATRKNIRDIERERKAKVKQTNTVVNAAWQKKYRDVDTRTVIRGAAEEYISETAGPWAELQAALDKGDIRDAGKRYEQTRNSMIDAAIKGLGESYEGAELQYLTSLISANGDPEKIKNISREYVFDRAKSSDYARQGYVDSEGMAAQNGMEFVTDKRAKELQAKAKEILSPINRELAPLKAKANKEQAALDEFASLTVDARKKFDAVTRETLGDGADALRDTYEKRADDLSNSKKKLEDANKRLDNPPDHVKRQMTERAESANTKVAGIDEGVSQLNELTARRGELQAELNKLTAASAPVIDKEQIRELQEEYKKNKQIINRELNAYDRETPFSDAQFKTLMEQSKGRLSSEFVERHATRLSDAQLKEIVAQSGGQLSDAQVKEIMERNVRQLSDAQLKNLVERNEKLLYARETKDWSKVVKKPTVDKDRIKQLTDNITSLDKQIEELSGKTTEKIQSVVDNQSTVVSEYAKLQRDAEAKAQDVKTKEQDLLDAQNRLNKRLSPEGQAELDAERREDIIGFARKQDERLAEGVAKANAHRADEYSLNTQALANQENAYQAAVSVANQKHSDYVAYKKTADETKKAADTVVAGAEERIKNAKETQANAGNIVTQAVENAVAEGNKREEKIRADADALTGSVNANEKSEISYANKQIDANMARYKNEEEMTRAAENAADAADKRVDKAQENVAKTRKQTEQNQKKLNLEISNETGVTTKNAERAVKDLEKSRKDVFKVNEETFLSDMENITTKFDAQAETYDALGKTIASGAGKNDYTTFSTGANFSTTGEISTAKLTPSALDDEKKKLQDWGRKLVQQEKDLKKTELEWHDANNAWQEAIKDRSVSPEERRKRLNKTGARVRELEERYNNKTNAFYENKGKFHSAVSDWKKRRDAWSPSVSAPPTPPSSGFSVNGNVPTSDANLAEYWKEQKQLSDQQRKEALENFYALRRDAREGKTNTPRSVLRSQQKAFLDAARKARNAGAFADYNLGTLAGESSGVANNFDTSSIQATGKNKSYNDLFADFLNNDPRYKKISNRYANFNPRRWNLPGRAFEWYLDKKVDAAFDDADAEFRKIYGTEDEYNARQQANATPKYSYSESSSATGAFSASLDKAAKSQYTLNEATKEATINGKQYTVNMNGAAQSAENLGKSAEKSALGLQALRFAGNAAVGALKLLGGMAVSMLAWTAVVKIFEMIAEYAHKTAEDMREAGRISSDIANNDQQAADDAYANVSSDKEMIDAFIEKAGSQEPINAVEAKRLKDQYEYLKKKGILTDAEVVEDSDMPSGYRILNAGAANTMKARAIGLQLDELEKGANKNKIDLFGLDPSRFAPDTYATPEQVKNIIGDYEGAANAIDKLSLSQRKKLFGSNDWISGWLNPLADKSLFEDVNAVGTWGNKNSIKEVIDARIKEIKKLGELSAEDESALRSFLERAATYSVADAERNGGEGAGMSFLHSLSEDQGQSFLDFFKLAKDFGAANLAAEDLKKEQEAYLAEAKKETNEPYSSGIDQANADAKQEDAAVEAAVEAATALEGISAALTKSDDKAKTPAQRELDALNEQWAEIEKKMEGVSDFDVLGEYYAQEQKLMEKRKELQEKINEELEKEQQKRAEEENKARSEERNAYLTGRFGDVVKAIANNDADAAKMNEGFFDSLLVNRKMFNGIDLSDFYRESANLIKDSIEKTNVTLSSRSTMNAYEAMDMSRDVQIDVQKQQLAELRAANSTFRNIYAWMQQDEQYKEFI